MAFLKVQNLKLNKDGQVLSGSASIIDTAYDPKVKGHSRHRTRESLGKVLMLSPDRKSGIFLSERGVLSYDAASDTLKRVSLDDERLKGITAVPAIPFRMTLGNVYLLINYLQAHGWLALFRKVFTEDELYERFLIHLVHGF